MSKKTYGLLLLANGMAQAVEFPEVDMDKKLDWYYKLIDCRCIDIVEPYGVREIAKAAGLEEVLAGKFCLICDDEALLKEKPEVNVLASLLYGADLHGQPLCGDALVAKNEYTEDGLDSVGLNDDDMNMLQAVINALIDEHNEKVAANH